MNQMSESYNEPNWVNDFLNKERKLSALTDAPVSTNIITKAITEALLVERLNKHFIKHKCTLNNEPYGPDAPRITKFPVYELYDCGYTINVTIELMAGGYVTKYKDLEENVLLERTYSPNELLQEKIFDGLLHVESMLRTGNQESNA